MRRVSRREEPLTHDAAIANTKLAHGNPSVAVVVATLFDDALAEDGSLNHGGGGGAWTSLDEFDCWEGRFGITILGVGRSVVNVGDRGVHVGAWPVGFRARASRAGNRRRGRCHEVMVGAGRGNRWRRGVGGRGLGNNCWIENGTGGWVRT